jgi:hypothetical protein
MCTDLLVHIERPACRGIDCDELDEIDFVPLQRSASRQIELGKFFEITEREDRPKAFLVFSLPLSFF